MFYSRSEEVNVGPSMYHQFNYAMIKCLVVVRKIYDQTPILKLRILVLFENRILHINGYVSSISNFFLYNRFSNASLHSLFILISSSIISKLIICRIPNHVSISLFFFRCIQSKKLYIGRLSLNIEIYQDAIIRTY